MHKIITQKLGALERDMSFAKASLNENQKRCYNPKNFGDDFEGAELVLYYKGVYVRAKDVTKIQKTLAAKNINITLATLKRLIADESRWDELWLLDIETHYINRLHDAPHFPYYISTRGDLLKLNLTKIMSNPRTSSVEVVIDEYYWTINRGRQIITTFTSKKKIEEGRKLFFRNGIYTDCGIDNVTLSSYNNVDGETVEWDE